MGKRRTTLEKIEAIRKKIATLSEKISELQGACPHTDVKTRREIVGFNGYGNDYESLCHCELCDMSWFHDGYCTGGHENRKAAA